MTELLTAAQMRAIEQAAIESGAVTGRELMERAGQGVVDAVLAEWAELNNPPSQDQTDRLAEEWPDLARGNRRATILCGPGNNDGDGFVVARLLRQEGWDVLVFLFGDPNKLPPDAKKNYDEWGLLGTVDPLTPDIGITHTDPDLVVDALFGTGLSRALAGFERLFLELNEDTISVQGLGGAGCRVTAVDLPSGLCSDSGKVLVTEPSRGESAWWRPTGVHAQLTVGFHTMKPGHVLDEGPIRSGKIVIADIGL